MGFGHELQHLLFLCAPVLLSWEQTSSSLVLQGDVQQICTEVGSQATGEEEGGPGPLLLVCQGGNCQVTSSDARARALGDGLGM